MGQIHGDNLGSPVAIVTEIGELLTTGSIAIKSTQEDVNLFQVIQKMDEVLKTLKITNEHLEIITDSEITETEVKE